MLRAKAQSPVARIALAIAVLVALLATAVGVTIWKYDHALAKAEAAQESRTEEYRSQKAATTFWNEREAMNEYLLIPEAELLAEVEEMRAEFQSVEADLGDGSPGARGTTPDQRGQRGQRRLREGVPRWANPA